MRKLLITLFAVLATATTASAYDFEVDGIFYNVLSFEDLTCEVSRNDKFVISYYGDVVIPSTVTYGGRKYSVTKIGNCAFFDCNSLTSVEIPNSVTTIGSEAFHACTSLTSLEIPNSVTTIEVFAFCHCFRLTSVEIPSSVTTIGGGLFYACDGLTSVVIPNSVTAIGERAFAFCSNLKEIISLAVLPTTIGSDAFKGVSETECIVKVPAESVNAYKEAKSWSSFWNIEPIDITGIKMNLGSATNVQGSTYNLQGQPVGDGYKGIVIQNGRKIIK